MMETSFFMSHESLIIGKRPWYLRLRGKLYLLLQRNALRAPDQFEIPPNRVIELGTRRNLMSKSPSIAKGFVSHPVVMSCCCLAKRFDGDHISLFW